MKTALTPHQKKELPGSEALLDERIRAGDSEGAANAAAQIQALLGNDRGHYRVLRAKLKCFEAHVDANQLAYAETGLIGIRALAPKSSRLHLEASTLLAICYLRKKKIPQAKQLIREVVKKLNNITSDARRRQYHKRLIERVEHECILSGLLETGEDLDLDGIHNKAVSLVQAPEDELYEFLASAIPSTATARLEDVRNYSILLLPPADRKALLPTRDATRSSAVGKKAFGVIGRIAWKALCNPEGKVFKLWSQNIPEVYEKGYFAAAVITALKEWHIGASLFASGAVALAMKHSAKEFCEWAKPKAMMIERGEHD